jgi:hypothetical protein
MRESPRPRLTHGEPRPEIPSSGGRPSYRDAMGLIVAAGWGAAGGVAAGLVALASAIAAAGMRWPWRRHEGWPQFVVFLIGAIVGMLVAGAAHSDMIGAWPAFLMGVAGPSVIRGAIRRTEVAALVEERGGT